LHGRSGDDAADLAPGPELTPLRAGCPTQAMNTAHGLDETLVSPPASPLSPTRRRVVLCIHREQRGWEASTPRGMAAGDRRPLAAGVVTQRLEETPFDAAVLTWDGFLMGAYSDEVDDPHPEWLEGDPGAAEPWRPLLRVHVHGHVPWGWVMSEAEREASAREEDGGGNVGRGGA
jgi:hypothetical protein